MPTMASIMAMACLATTSITAFSPSTFHSITNAASATATTRTRTTTKLSSSTSDDDNDGSENAAPGLPPKLTQEQEDVLQWDLFTKHHAKGKWRGTWTTYDYMGDVIDSTVASVNLEHDVNTNTVTHTHDIVVGSTSSDCNTCFDSTNIKTMPVGTYTPGNISKYRCGSTSMVCGPSLLRSGAMSTELILSFGNGRVRVVYQHAPVWEAGVEPGSCPPQGLKLFRTMVSREVLEDVENGVVGQPTFESEQVNEPKRGNPKFFRPIPPFKWHNKWAGTSWTWGPQTGDRGWEIQDMDEADAWHGRPTGDTSDVWAMRLPGGILLQAPRVITSGMAGLCRLAWLPEDDGEVGTEADGDPAKLLRVEASVMALEPVIDEENDVMVGFYPPSLGSLRCDVLMKVGELEDASVLDKLMSMGEMDKDKESNLGPKSEGEGDDKKNGGSNGEPPLDDSGLDAVRNALRL